MTLTQLILAALLAVAAPLTLADWQLNNSLSRLSFVSTKAGNLAEVHRFKQLDGAIDKDRAELVIALDSIDSLIPLRDERMKSMLFEVERFGQARVNIDLDTSAIAKLNSGEVTPLEVAGTLDLHGQQKPLTIHTLVSRLSDNRLVVASWQPLIINASDFALVKGVEALRSIAMLPSISTAVPVSFVLVFDKQ